METLRVWIEIPKLNTANQMFQLSPTILTRAAIMAILGVGKGEGGMIIVIIITEDVTNFINIKMELINRTLHHQISNLVDRTRDDNGCGLLRILTVFGFYDFLFEKCCGTYNHRLVLWLLVYFWCIINLLWFNSVKLWEKKCRTI